MLANPKTVKSIVQKRPRWRISSWPWLMVWFCCSWRAILPAFYLRYSNHRCKNYRIEWIMLFWCVLTSTVSIYGLSFVQQLFLPPNCSSFFCLFPCQSGFSSTICTDCLDSYSNQKNEAFMLAQHWILFDCCLILMSPMMTEKIDEWLLLLLL